MKTSLVKIGILILICSCFVTVTLPIKHNNNGNQSVEASKAMIYCCIQATEWGERDWTLETSAVVGRKDSKHYIINAVKYDHFMNKIVFQCFKKYHSNSVYYYDD